ncbi:MAG: UDP-N-acetylenolpyruvoylglucosamine reductase, partial [Bifidobacterium crudilactis]|nr:UDP-N-acetylenolpyruvoylglucosamine reductase [Bifidobacterium crudilactis]
ASFSTVHTLALTNRGDASCSQILDLAVAVRDGVESKFGVRLVPEPVLVGGIAI